jgi:DNA-3-methyladenine glycosylase II
MASERAISRAGADADTGIAAASAADPMLAAFIARAGPVPHRAGEGDYFGSLVRAIVFQQLAGRAAAAIHGRMLQTLDGDLTPAALLAVEPERLRGAGLSGAKTASLIDLATKVLDGTVPLDGIEALDDDEIIARLSAVRGIGRWTAEMFLMFELRRPDVWPVDDLGVRNGWSLIHELPQIIKPRDLAAAGEPFRPHRSLVAWYCWHAVHVARGQLVLPGGEAT